MLKYIRIYLIIQLVLSFHLKLNAQNMIMANPADILDFRSVFVNPAALSFHNSHVAMGGKVYHLGFVEGQSNPFRQGFVSMVLPFSINDEMGLGVQAQYFNTPIFSQSNVTFALAKRFQQKYAFGIKFNVFSKSFNRDNFDLVDPDDPVFRNGTTVWSASFGAGVSVFPLPNLSLGVGVDHINRANVSLTNDNVYQPLKGYFGAVLNLGLVQASISTSYEDGRFLPTTTIGSTIYNVGYFKLSYSERAFQAEGQVRITGAFSMNYNYEYTLFDAQGFGQGSHQLAFLHEFGRTRELPEIYMPDEFILEFRPPEKLANPEARFYVYSNNSKLEIIEKKLTRVVDSSVKQEELSQLSQFDIGILDSSRTERNFPYEKEPVNMELIPATLEATLSKDYDEFMKDVAKDVDRKGFQTNIIASKDSYLRAAGLRKYFDSDSLGSDNVAFIEPVYKSPGDSLLALQKLGSRPVMPKETLIILSEQNTKFEIMPVSYVLTPESWKLIIENRKGKEIKRFEGSEMPLQEIVWDWRDNSGKLIQPGLYAYYLEWRDPKGIDHQTAQKFITVQKLLRNITIEITKQPKEIGDDVNEIDIILKK